MGLRRNRYKVVLTDRTHIYKAYADMRYGPEGDESIRRWNINKGTCMTCNENTCLHPPIRMFLDDPGLCVLAHMEKARGATYYQEFTSP